MAFSGGAVNVRITISDSECYDCKSCQEQYIFCIHKFICLVKMNEVCVLGIMVASFILQ